MRPVVLVFVFFAIMMGLLAAYLAKVWLDSRTPIVVQQQAQPDLTGTVQVLVAARPISAGTRLTHDDFKWAAWPKSAVQDRFVDQSKISEAALDAQQQPPNAPTTPIVNSGGSQGEAAAAIVLIGAVTRRQILDGEPIGLESIVQPGDRSVASAVIAPGMRAYSIPVQAEAASAGFINPGDHVDVMLAANLRSAMGDRTKQSSAIVNWAVETVLYNVKVLAVDQQLSHDPKDGAAIVGKILTLEVKPLDAEKLFTAQQLGPLSITLRSLVSDRSDSAKSRDVDNPSVHPFTTDKEASRALNSLFLPTDSSPPAPAPAVAVAAPPPAPEPAPEPVLESAPPTRAVVRINRGGTISQQSF